MMNRAYNFFPGPSSLSDQVFAEVLAQLPQFNQMGASIMEVSHRSTEFIDYTRSTLDKLREVAKVPEEFAIALIPGGATAISYALALNCLPLGSRCAFALSGHWSLRACNEVAKNNQVNIVCDNKDNPFELPALESWSAPSANDAFLHICDNETITGLEYNQIPQIGLPVFVDMSSNFISRPIAWDEVDCVYCCGQKSLGVSGFGVVFIKRKWFANIRENVPCIWDFQLQANELGMANTPGTMPILVLRQVLDWFAKLGGIDYFTQLNKQKADLLYDAIDNSDFYVNHVPKKNRSRMNVGFFIPKDPKLEGEFISKAKEYNLIGLAGHKVIGGLRASIYNAMPLAGVESLVDFMNEFAKLHR